MEDWLFAGIVGAVVVAVWFVNRKVMAIDDADVVTARRLPASSLASPGPGLVKLVGVVEGPVRRAPLDGRPCIGFDLMVDSDDRYGSIGDMGERREVPDFMLRGPDGVVLVRGERLRLKLLQPVVRRLSPNELPAVLPGFTGRFSSYVRACQWAIPVGARLAVIGMVRREPDPDPAATDSYRESGTRLVIDSPEGCRAYLVDDPRALT